MTARGVKQTALAGLAVAVMAALMVFDRQDIPWLYEIIGFAMDIWAFVFLFVLISTGLFFLAELVIADDDMPTWKTCAIGASLLIASAGIALGALYIFDEARVPFYEERPGFGPYEF